MLSMLMMMLTLLMCVACGWAAAKRAKNENFSVTMTICAIMNAVGATVSAVQILHS